MSEQSQDPRQPEPARRLAYLDWMRGFACLLMFQTHCYDSWLSSQARNSLFFHWSQNAGTLPAPLFIFLAGVSFALVTNRLREKGITQLSIAQQTILRGAEIFGLGLLFRLQEYILGYGWVPWTDLFRVDVLNILGLSMILMGVLCWLTAGGVLVAARRQNALAALLIAIFVAMATPPLWTTHRPRFLPWPIESYINGVHIFSQPQTWLFPLFPWSAFAFAGLAVGFYLASAFTKNNNVAAFALLGAAGILACVLSLFFDQSSIHLYSVYDYWHSSPNFLLMRCGILLLILFGVYAWCRWGFAERGFSPVMQLGKNSLLVYWVHIEFVYGRFAILPKRACSIPTATAGLLLIFLAMLGLSLVRTNWQKIRTKVLK
jgi:uncharacterized membrane protein